MISTFLPNDTLGTPIHIKVSLKMHCLAPSLFFRRLRNHTTRWTIQTHVLNTISESTSERSLGIPYIYDCASSRLCKLCLNHNTQQSNIAQTGALVLALIGSCGILCPFSVPMSPLGASIFYNEPHTCRQRRTTNPFQTLFCVKADIHTSFSARYSSVARHKCA